MAETWDWATCRRLSEKVFKRISDGRLKSGWADQAARKDLQRNVCMAASQRTQVQQAAQVSYVAQFPQPQSSQASTASRPAPSTSSTSTQERNTLKTQTCLAISGIGETIVVSQHPTVLSPIGASTIALGMHSVIRDYLLIENRTV